MRSAAHVKKRFGKFFSQKTVSQKEIHHVSFVSESDSLNVLCSRTGFAHACAGCMQWRITISGIIIIFKCTVE
jgi:hypothetical protein